MGAVTIGGVALGCELIGGVGSIGYTSPDAAATWCDRIEAGFCEDFDRAPS